MKNLQQCLKYFRFVLPGCLGIFSFFNVVSQDSVRKARPELIVGSMDFSLNSVRLAQQKFPQWKGQGRMISVKEERPDLEDIDLRGRYIPSSFASPNVNAHASLMTTIIAGAGNSWYAGRGAAPGAQFGSVDFASLEPEPIAYYQLGKINVQNHSYGVGIENEYGRDAQRYDSTAYLLPSLLHVFSAGNRGGEAPGLGTYRGIRGFANLTGSFKMAKNVLVVGAVDSFGVAERQSSRGPAYDGRIKPELVAFGEDGSSGAAALISGIAALMQEAYLERKGQEMDNSLARAVLVNSARDLGTPGPDFVYGFGNADAEAALRTISEDRIFSGTIASRSTWQEKILVPAGILQLKVSLAWTDLPAPANAVKALQQDLDLELEELATGRIWKPWVLSSFPHADSLAKPAARAIDTLNNIEQVTIDIPGQGEYLVRVRAGQLREDQDFHLGWQLDASEQFQWLFPLRTEPIVAASKAVIRWKASADLPAGIFSYSIDEGASWLPVNTGVDLRTGYFSWFVPNVNGRLLLKMQAGARAYISDTIVLSSILQPVVGFSCPDSILLSWGRVPGADRYQVYRLGEKYLEYQSSTSDTLVVLPRVDFPENQLAIAPIFQQREGYRSRTLDHTTQGVGCYTRSLIAQKEGAAILVGLELGTSYGLRSIRLEKWIGGAYDEIAVRNNPDSLRYQFPDQEVIYGTNRYRARLALIDGRTIYTDPADLFWVPPAGYRIYPNPVSKGSDLFLAADNITDESLVQVIDAQGKWVLSTEIKTSPQRLDISHLPPGLYYARVIRLNKVAWTTKFIIRS